MKRISLFILAGMCILHAFAMPMAPMAPMTIEGDIQKIAWHPEKQIKGKPGLSGRAGTDRTRPAHYALTLTNSIVTACGDGYLPFQSGQAITLTLPHAKDDQYLKQNMRIKIVGFRMQGDEGGVTSSYKKLLILNEKTPRKHECN